MRTIATVVTKRGQVSVPAEILKRMKLSAGQKVVWEMTSPTECRVTVAPAKRRAGASAMLGHASTFRPARKTQDWMGELREGD